MIEDEEYANRVSTMVVLEKWLALLERLWTNVSLSVLCQYLIEKDIITLSKLGWVGVWEEPSLEIICWIHIGKYSFH